MSNRQKGWGRISFQGEDYLRNESAADKTLVGISARGFLAFYLVLSPQLRTAFFCLVFLIVAVLVCTSYATDKGGTLTLGDDDGYDGEE
ncbi:hypothetical protein LSTR_LSTR000060 [Laodelphax striatellus]|uniref:Uncharacterized protein n=1 Tax=Laodelphax striatellus TaxID=195883 RepID=A0A482X6T2_LAOST|nr:hypothetical protein LSTR_LSTR000060 [Laodelphax striatellus]